jgi:SEC-C motif domain protein
MSLPENCPCGSGQPYAVCCEPLLRGQRRAQTAEELMRSRYCAFVVQNIPYLMRTTASKARRHNEARDLRAWSEHSDWLGLEVVDVDRGGPGDDAGTVEFIARFAVNGVENRHHERSEFVRQGGQWVYAGGKDLLQRQPLRRAASPGRNDPCPCGSGRKYKKCCGAPVSAEADDPA